MAERKLNFNAPLMSVRRIASRPVSPVRTPPPLPTADQVTEPVAVPFHWEQIPGLAKGTNKEPKKKLAPGKKKNRREEEEDEDEDAYSDALDTMCSHSQESGSDGGGFSTDPHTRNFMMNRFLPAAKAMAFTYTPKKQSPKPTPKPVIHTRLSLPPNGVSPSQEKQQQQQESESESDGEDRNEPQVVTERGCGLFPRLCFRNSLSLLGPLPALKLSSPKPNRSAYNQSISKSVKKAWDTHMKRLESESFSPQRREGRDEKGKKKKKNGDESKRSFSGEIIGRLSPFRSSRAADERSRSGELHMFDNKGRDVEKKRFAYSGELNRGRLSPLRSTRPAENPKTDRGSRSAEMKMAENKRASDPRRLAYSGDLHRVSSSLSSSPFRPTSRAASISPYRNQSPQSPFRRGTFLGLPKEENAKAGNKFQQVSGSRRSFSPIPAIEKTLYVDSAERGSGYLGSRPRFHSGEQLRGPRWAEEEFSFQDLKSLNNTMALEILEQEMCVPKKSRHRQEVKCKTLNAKADTDNGLNSSSAKSPLHPPLPRSPSESWLWRTISLRNSFSLKEEAKDSEPKISSTSTTKWETIVKTSKSHHDHARYSQELVAHISKQS